MTDQTEQGRLPLPGLDEPKARGVSDLEAAIRRTLRELHAQGHVNEVDAGKAQLAIELAQVISVKRATGRASTIGHDARVLMEILDKFVDEATDVDDTLREAMDAWSEEMSPADLEQDT
jgi:hypothetical protein